MKALALPAPHPSIWARLVQALDLQRSRRSLGALPPHMLRDIGLTEAQAQSEAARPIWDAPDHWHKGM